LDEFDLAQMGFLPGSGLPSGICPAQFQSCTVFPNGVIIGQGAVGLTAFTFGQSLNGAGSPCSARDVEAGDCSVSGTNVLGTLNFSSLGNTLGSAYGTVLGFLGKYFRGRPPGQSFAACVGQNMSLTFTGSPKSPISTTVTSGTIGISGLMLGGPTFGGATLAARLGIAAKVFMTALPEDEAIEQPSSVAPSPLDKWQHL
jgi:hypothetical protein